MAAIELVSKLIEDSTKVDVEEIEVKVLVNRTVGYNFVPQDEFFLFAIETKIFFALGHPWVKR